MMKRLTITLFTILMICAACNNRHEEVVAKWNDGKPQIVREMVGKKDHSVKVSETTYYADGSIQAKKHYNSKTGKPDGHWTFYYPTGSVFATADFDNEHSNGCNWQFSAPDGNPLVSGDYDSVIVTELSDIETPATACFHRGNTQTWYQFFSNGSIHGLGTSVNNVREGRWVFYYPNGQMQTEATFVGGREEGAYNVYRDNGAPYYLGHYLNGERTGTWEVYDPEGNLVTTKQY